LAKDQGFFEKKGFFGNIDKVIEIITDLRLPLDVCGLGMATHGYKFRFSPKPTDQTHGQFDCLIKS
jgi:hypothetical protein